MNGHGTYEVQNDSFMYAILRLILGALKNHCMQQT
jgi:hypothetical protein